MNKRALLIVLLLVPLMVAWGRPRFSSSRHKRGSGSEFEFSLGAGWSMLNYQLTGDQLRNNGSYGLKAHLGYAYFFTPNVGLRLGADFSRYGTTLALPDELVWSSVNANGGGVYDHYVMLDRWREQHNALYAEIPLSVCLSFPLSHMRVCAEVGAKYGFFVAGGSKAGGGISHQGYYDQYHLWLYDTPNHGYYTTETFRPQSELTFKPMWSAFVKAGVAFPLTRFLELSCKVYGDFGITNIMPDGCASNPIGFRNDMEGMEQMHGFMSDYTNLLNTNQIGDKANALSVGVEVGVCYYLPNKRRGACHCLRGSSHSFGRGFKHGSRRGSRRGVRRFGRRR